MKIFNISQGQFTSIARWNSTAPVEGQDRLNDWLVVSELGTGPNGKFPTSNGPVLHLFDLSTIDIDVKPVASIALSQYIDAILHVKFVEMGRETWVVCSGGFATTTLGAVVLVNMTSVLSDPTLAGEVEVNVLSTTVMEPEGVMISPSDNRYVYIGGIKSTTMAVIDISTFWGANVVETRNDVGAQLVGATWLDQANQGGFSQSLVFFACWGLDGGLTVLDTGTNPASPPEVARSVSYATSQANRVKLDPSGKFAYVPLEQELGGVAVYDIEGVSDGVLTLNSTVHVPVSEFHNGPDGGFVTSTKTYCLAVSGSNKLFVFIAETASVYIYDVSL